MPQYDLGLDQRTAVPRYKSSGDPFVTEQKPDDPPPGYRVKGDTMEEIMPRIKEVWPKDDVYCKKGSTGTPNALQCSGDAKSVPSPDSAKATGFHPEDDLFKSRGRSRARRGKSGRNGSKSPSSDRSLSPLPPKMQFFSGDPSKGSWSSFIIKFERTADRHKWGEDKKLDRLFGCLNDKALEYAVKCKNNRDYDSLKKELKLRFDLSDEPVAARHKLGVAKQTDDESLEIFMQRVLGIASDAFGGFDNKVMQQMATEAFLRGCNNKEAASFVLVSSPSTIQEACQKMKMVIANKKAVEGSKVSFQERVFTSQEDKRVSDLERKVNVIPDIERKLNEIAYTLKSRSPNRSSSTHRYNNRSDGQYYSRDRYNQSDRDRYNQSDRDRYNQSYQRGRPQNRQVDGAKARFKHQQWKSLCQAKGI